MAKVLVALVVLMAATRADAQVFRPRGGKAVLANPAAAKAAERTALAQPPALAPGSVAPTAAVASSPSPSPGPGTPAPVAPVAPTHVATAPTPRPQPAAQPARTTPTSPTKKTAKKIKKRPAPSDDGDSDDVVIVDDDE